MLITTISYRRTFNLGNYENETIELTAHLDLNESSEEAMEKLKVKVHAFSANSPVVVGGQVTY